MNEHQRQFKMKIVHENVFGSKIRCVDSVFYRIDNDIIDKNIRESK